MELISKEVVKRIIDSGRTREQMLEIVESAVAVDSSTDCISREAVLDKAVYTETEEGWSGKTVDVKVIEALPPVNPKVDVDALINKIETELSWSMYDDWGNTTDLHDRLVEIIKECCKEKKD